MRKERARVVVAGVAVHVPFGVEGAAWIAARQRGLVTTPQLVAIGFAYPAVTRRVQAGRLHPVHRGVYAVGHPVLAPLARELAAVLATGDGAVVSHRSALKTWGLLRYDGPVEVIIEGRGRRSRPGIVVHRTGSIPAADVRTLERVLPLVAPGRALDDAALFLPPRDLERAVNEALVLKKVTEQELRTRPRLKHLVDDGPRITRSEAERRLIDLIKSSGLPRPETNVTMGNYEVDVLWREERTIVKVDGFAFHSTRQAFERDRRKDAWLQTRGYVVIRISWRQLVEEPHTVLVTLAQVLARAA